MSKNKSSALAARAWHLLRLALRCKRQLVSSIHLALTSVKPLCDNRRHRRSYSLSYGEHELSFGDTPTFRFVKKHRRGRPFFSCIGPPLVNFDDDENVDEDDGGAEEEEERAMDGVSCRGNEIVEGEDGVDAKAEEFISRFYEEMKLQRQLSLLKYNEMICGGRMS